ncbi:hypothetical protein E4U59_005274 [Claviceps monticola]|nr:hypothetical protein E4U59_005274 [Claviceps monticola]
MKSDTEAELDVASTVDVKADVKPTEDTGCEVRESVEVEVGASLQGMLAGDPTEASDAAGMLCCVLGKLELLAVAVLETGEVDEEAVDTLKLPTNLEVGNGIDAELVCTSGLETRMGLEEAPGIEVGVVCEPRAVELLAAAVLEAGFAVDAEDAAEVAVEAGVLTRVGNLSFKLVWYAVLDERELELAGDGIDAAGMLCCVLGKLELLAVAVLEAGFAVDEEAVDTLKLPTNLEVGNGIDAELVCTVRDPCELDAMSEVDAVLDAEGKLDPLARDKLEIGAEREADIALETSTEVDATLTVE